MNKKNQIIIFILIIVLLSFLFSACTNKNIINDNKVEYEKIALSKENYTRYIAINTSISNFNYDNISNDKLSPNYNILCTVDVTTHKSIECYFENAILVYKYISTWQDEVPFNPTLTNELSTTGYSSSSVSLLKNNTTSLNLPIMYNEVIVEVVRGYVYIQKE